MYNAYLTKAQLYRRTIYAAELNSKSYENWKAKYSLQQKTRWLWDTESQSKNSQNKQ